MATSTIPKSSFGIALRKVCIEHRLHNDRRSHTHDEGDIPEATRQPGVHTLPRRPPARQPRRNTLAEQNNTNCQSKQNNSNESKAKRYWTQDSLNPHKPHKKPKRVPPSPYRQETESPSPCQFESSSPNKTESLSLPYDIKSPPPHCLISPRSQAREVRIWSIQTDDTRILADDRSTLEFDDSSDRELTREKEDLIPEVEELALQEEIFEAVRAGLKIDLPKIAKSMSRLTPTQYDNLFSNTAIRVVYDSDSVLDDLERADCHYATRKAAKAYGIYDQRHKPRIKERLVEEGVYLELRDLLIAECIEDAVRDLRKFYPQDEPMHRALFWEQFIFLLQSRGRAKASEKQRVIRISEQRIQTVALIKGEASMGQAEKKDRSKPTKMYPPGIMTYYPAIMSNASETSIIPGKMPAIVLKLSSAYIWLDLGYAVEANDILEMFSLELPHLAKLPVNRLFWKRSRKHQHISPFHFLNHLMIEIKPLPESKGGFDKLMRKAVRYLVLNASACLHDYMKLLWLGAPVGSIQFHSETPVIYLIAAVGFFAKVLCLHIRKFNGKKPQPASIKYEAVEMGTFDLTKEKDQKNFPELYNSIQALAHYYANLHRIAMINAMKSGRDIAVTELPELSFVQSEEQGKLFFQMINEDGVVQHEGEEEMVVAEHLRKLAKGSTFEFVESLCGPPPKSDEADGDIVNESRAEYDGRQYETEDDEGFLCGSAPEDAAPIAAAAEAAAAARDNIENKVRKEVTATKNPAFRRQQRLNQRRSTRLAAKKKSSTVDIV